MRIMMVRHTAVDVPKGVCYGRTDVGLAADFNVEAARIRGELEAMVEERGKFDLVVASPAIRCVLLAEACGYGHALRDERLWELNFGEWEMKRYDEITDPVLWQWYDDWQHVAPTGGESFEQQTQRVAQALAEYQAAGISSLLMFAHGGIAMQLFLLGRKVATAEEAAASQPPYGGVVEIEIED